MKLTYLFRIVLLSCFLGISLPLSAQLAPLQPEQDCINAISVCQDTFIQVNSYVGEGMIEDEIDSGPSCMDSGEKNDVWYIFKISSPGELSFTITPNNFSDDYDWAVYDLTNAECSEIFTNPDLEVSCNWSFVTGETGPNGQGPGGFFNPFNPTIPVEVGEVYVVNVSNFSSTNFGYTLDFTTSSAAIRDNIGPTLNSDNACVGQNIPISFSENVQCATVEPSDFTFSGPGGPYTIVDVISTRCQNGGGFDIDFELVVSPATSGSGEYVVSLIDTVLDLCDNPSILSTDTINIVNVDPSFAFDLPMICQDTCITFNYSGAIEDSTQSYLWDFGPNAFPRTSPLANPTCIQFNQGGMQDISLTVTSGSCSVTEVKSVEIYNKPMVDLGPDVFVCEGEESITLTPSITNGTPDYNFQWSCNLPNSEDCGIDDPTIQNPTVEPNEAVLGTLPASTIYYLDVVDRNGCPSDRDSIIVDVRIRPKADAGPDQTLCAIGPGVFLDGEPDANNIAPEPFTYAWTPATGLSEATAANPFARPLTTTGYVLTVTSANGCESIPANDENSTVTVFVEPLPITEAGRDTVICQGDTIQLSGSASVAGPDYDFVWTPANTGYMSDPTASNPAVSPNFTTLYFLVATSVINGCTSLADSVRVTVSSTPTVSAGPNQSICLGEDIQLQGSASGDPDAVLFNYEWIPATGLTNPDARNPLASPDTTTTYQLVATSAFGCGSNTSSMLLTVKSSPIVQALNNDTLVCQGDALNLSATSSFTTTPMAPVTYSWSPDSSIITNPNMQNVIGRPVEATNYIVTASISGDCPSYDTVQVNVSADFNTMANADTSVICSGESVRLMASGGFGTATYQWLPASSVDNPTSSSPLASPTMTTVYQVVLTEAACNDTAEVTIQVNPTPSSDYVSSEPNGCEGLEVNFIENTQNAIAFIWNFGDGSDVSNEANPVHVYNQPGNYIVTLTAIGENGCASSSSATTVNISPSVEAEFTASPGVGMEIYMPRAMIKFLDQSANGQQWIWDFGDGTGSAEISPTHTYTAAGEYQVTLTVKGENGCIDQFSLGPFTILAPDLFIPNVFSPNNDGINDDFLIRYRGDKDFYVEVFDRWGRKMYTSANPADGWNGIKESGDLAEEGVYYYIVQIGTENYTGDVTLLR